LAQPSESFAESEAAAAKTPADIERFLRRTSDSIAPSARCGESGFGALITSMSGALRGSTVRMRGRRSRAGRTVAEHRAVVQAIAGHDPERARLRCEVHLVGVGDVLPGPAAQVL